MKTWRTLYWEATAFYQLNTDAEGSCSHNGNMTKLKNESNPTVCFKRIDSLLLPLLQDTHTSVERPFYIINKLKSVIMEWFRPCDFSVLAWSTAKGKRDEREQNENSMDAKKNQSFGWRRNQKPFQSKRLINYLPINSMWTAVQK